MCYLVGSGIVHIMGHVQELIIWRGNDMGKFLICAIVCFVMVMSHTTGFAGMAQITDANVGVLFTIPHNEPVINDKVARYRLDHNIGVKLFNFVKINYKGDLWAVNTWRTPEVVGHGFPDAWRGSDWTVEGWRYDYLVTAYMPVTSSGRLNVGVEHNKYWWITPDATGGHASNYWWQVGIKYIFIGDK